jgi:hypothetical protein
MAREKARGFIFEANPKKPLMARFFVTAHANQSGMPDWAIFHQFGYFLQDNSDF